MEKIHIRNLFQILVPISINVEVAVTTTVRTEPFGIDLLDGRNLNIKLVGTDYFGNIKHEPKNCFTWAKRTPISFQQDAEKNVIGVSIRLKINQGVFDFRKTKDRMFQIIVELVENGTVTKTGTSRIWELFPKRRHVQNEEEEADTVVPIYWLGSDGYLDDYSSPSVGQSSSNLSPLDYSHGVAPENENLYRESEASDTRNSIFGSSILAVGSSSEENTDSMILRDTADFSESNDNYMVLYNGNAEVVGNFRALNFYKASDINIKEDVELLDQERDCRASLLRINGVSYKFKPGISHTTNKRFIGYIAQQIESVVPEAVQLIDGILHVDYESLIPYLSESIKQNYSDIQSVTSEVDRIRLVVDALYEQFTSNTKPQSSSPNKRTNKAIGWIVGALALSALIIAAVLGVLFFAGQTHHVPLSALQSPTIDERSALLELFYAMQLNGTLQQNFTGSHCSWYGISCNATTGRVISIRINAFADDHNRKPISSTIPESIGDFTELRVLDLQYNNLVSTIPQSITNLKSLEILLLDTNLELKGTLPMIDSLKELSISETSLLVDETTLATLANMSSIEFLSIRHQPINGTLPQSLSPSLSVLILSDCGLRGTIPKSWEDSNITYLDISKNGLVGSIPCLGKNITDFFAENNDFDGTFCGTAFKEIQTLSLANAKLSGDFDLPNTRMIRLDIKNNRFTSFLSSKSDYMGLGCRADDNPFKCPIPEWAKDRCRATCN